MIVIDPGHYYGCHTLDAPPERWTQLLFVKRQGDKYTLHAPVGWLRR